MPFLQNYSDLQDFWRLAPESVFPIKLSEDSVFKTLSLSSDCRVSERTRHIVKQSIHTVRRHSSPAAVWKILPVTRADSKKISLNGEFIPASRRVSHTLSYCREAIVFALSLGPKVDSIIRESGRASCSYQFVLDKTASLAAESFADELQFHISHTLKPFEATTKRYSPGYCDWPVSEQKALFQLLPDRPADIHLHDSCLMSPRKSVTGIMGIGDRHIIEQYGNACLTCGRKTCPYRRSAN